MHYSSKKVFIIVAFKRGSSLSDVYIRMFGNHAVSAENVPAKQLPNGSNEEYCSVDLIFFVLQRKGS